MNKIATTRPSDLMATVGGSVPNKVQSGSDEFKSLLDGAMLGANKSSPGNRKTPVKTDKAEKPAKSEGSGKTDSGSATDIAAQQPAAEKTADEAVTAQATPVLIGQEVTALPVLAQRITAPATEAPQMVAQAEANPDTTPGGDILSMETIVTTAEDNIDGTGQGIPQAVAPSTQATEDRFTNMLGEAHRQLQALSNQETDAEAATDDIQPDIPVAEITVESELPEETAPILEGDIPEAPVDTDVPQPPTPRVQQPMIQRAEPQQNPIKEVAETDDLTAHLQQNQASAPPAQPVRDIERTQAPDQPERPQFYTEQAEQIRVRVQENLEQNRMEFRMQLQPEELGRINVKLVLEGGRLAVEIMAASPRSAELLSRQAESLVQSLKLNNGLDVQSVQVITETQNASGHMDGAFNMLNGQAQNGTEQNDAGQATNARHNPDKGGAFSDDTSQEDKEAAPKTLLNYTI